MHTEQDWLGIPNTLRQPAQISIRVIPFKGRELVFVDHGDDVSRTSAVKDHLNIYQYIKDDLPTTILVNDLFFPRRYYDNDDVSEFSRRKIDITSLLAKPQEEALSCFMRGVLWSYKYPVRAMVIVATPRLSLTLNHLEQIVNHHPYLERIIIDGDLHD